MSGTTGTARTRSTGTLRKRSPRTEVSRESQVRVLAERSAIFRMSPLALRSQLEAEWQLEEHEVTEDHAEPEIDEADLDERDEDAPPDTDDDNTDFTEVYATLLEESFGSESPLINHGDIYALRVVPTAKQQWECIFERPSWWAEVRTRQNAASTVLQDLGRFLSDTADWLTRHKQEFLEKPSAVTFAQDEWNGNALPIVTQEGFVARVTAGHSRKPRLRTLSKDNFSRAKGHMWVLWDDKSMPLELLFSEDFRMQWVMQVCLGRFPKRTSWPDMLAKFTREDLKRVAHINAETCSPEELLQKLCSRAGLSPKVVFKRMTNLLSP